ncbi:hypothetical protein M2323_004666 [Rhodoblastus acidophilus]|uniref:hypothetical protein n=1 Tax=Rhodoblastus acidophilus TaxID=1074 RepID=UPI0022240ABE|nr:hypothetical protein [Rhodoblastus acidophilus]MCW2286856.1 hypothetical protein [Rhodoblastus acidophilus]MCW2335710.1 hypothetical protein [Rhodoblastus acidophilus]
MSYINQANPVLTGAGTCFDLKINGLGALTFNLTDNGSNSTLTLEVSTDYSSWAAVGTRLYLMSANNTLIPVSGTSIVTKGKYVLDAKALLDAYSGLPVWVRLRVATYVSGTVVTTLEDSPATLQRLTSGLVTGLNAAGTNQINAMPILATFNSFSAVNAGAGSVLPGLVPLGNEVVVKNTGANALLVYPPIGGRINSLALNAALSVAASTVTRFISDGTGNFWTF